MNKAEDYASESDISDDDFRPDKEICDSASEEEDDETETGGDDEEDCDEKVKQRNKKPIKERTKKTTKKRSKKQQQKDEESDDSYNSNEIIDDDDDDDDESSSDYDSDYYIIDDENVVEVDKFSTQSTNIVTRQTEMNGRNSTAKKSLEKDDLDSDKEEDKSRTDALWADFLSDTKTTTVPVKRSATSTSTATTATTGTSASKISEATTANGNKSKINENLNNEPAAKKPRIVTEILDFAGEKVLVQKTINSPTTHAASKKENSAQVRPASNIYGLPTGFNRGGVGGGLVGLGNRSGGGVGSILNQIGKKKKLSVLEKTQMDWKSFKQDEGIEEELQTHNKGKDGYLERQDFLQRTDLRQFEIERNLRQSQRK